MDSQRPFEREWDYLLVLDAARYDVFADVYEDYFEGELRKFDSGASATPEWVDRYFTGFHDVTYFSANPYVNSLPLPLTETGTVPYETTPADHIARVIDIWDSGWDDGIGTVRPEEVNREFMIERDGVEGRTVLHYMQPHAPFLGRGQGRINRSIHNSFSKLKETGVAGGLGGLLEDRLSGIVERLEDSELAMKAGMLSNLDGQSLLEVSTGDARETLLSYHEENLREAMEYAARMARSLDGNVVVTSDHGEAFGEEGVWGHHIETHIPPLVEVPWLDVEGVAR
jgi:hypothetical protein